MKPECERCQTLLRPMDPAHICSYECTFCDKCRTEMASVCPNCGGELVRRPHRTLDDNARD
ncbi:DUF1272 domain-containing protein [Marinobacter sp. BGYM27]|uniref:DUF1272 domain-containing protein n=1 Tax=Marinobacter sp. BGYM27 TaxID=2975597 RepID=UPI0021A8A541|nr:DUF1272 domain-containing protein [Marinobacter sp. BGYM27]MDG5499521.1 DUF1272 domain-containing protein [Marinobacter sp. BGYM27]